MRRACKGLEFSKENTEGRARCVLRRLAAQSGREEAVGQVAMLPGSCPRRRRRLLL